SGSVCSRCPRPSGGSGRGRGTGGAPSGARGPAPGQRCCGCRLLVAVLEAEVARAVAAGVVPAATRREREDARQPDREQRGEVPAQLVRHSLPPLARGPESSPRGRPPGWMDPDGCYAEGEGLGGREGWRHRAALI